MNLHDGRSPEAPAADSGPTLRPLDASRGGLSRLVPWLLAACVVAGIAARLLWAAWDEGASFHPDEYGLAGTLSRLGWPDGPGAYFNTRLSPLSPYPRYAVDGKKTKDHGPDAGMRWGQWPQIVVRATAEGLGRVPFLKGRTYTGFQEVRLLGRRLSALADLLVLLLLYRTGRRLAGRRTALLAAALYALAALPIQQSHFLTVDPLATLFATAAVSLAAAAGLPEDGPRSRAGGDLPLVSIAFGAACGMAVASRVNLVPLLGLLPLAVFASPAHPEAGTKARLGRAAGALLLSLAAAVLVFRVTQPMSFRAPTGDTSLATWSLNPDWTRNMALAQAESAGDAGGPPAEQWASRTRLLFPFVNLAIWGLGPFLGLAGFLSLSWTAWLLIRRRDPSDVARLLVPAAWAGGFFLFMGTRWVSSVRYFLPIVPWLALLAAWGLLKAAGACSGTPFARRLVRALPGLVVAGTLAWAWAYTGVYRHGNPRLAASRWIYANVPSTLNGAGSGPYGPFEERLAAPTEIRLSPAPHSLRVVARHTGTLERLFAARLRSPGESGAPPVQVSVLEADGGRALLGEGTLGAPLAVPWKRGAAYEIRLSVANGEALLASSFLAGEHWDEALPASLGGDHGGLYRGRLMEIRGPDNERKREGVLRNVEEADVIVLASQRAVWAAPRLPGNYPFTLAYYRALFDGSLGFDPVPGSPFQVPLAVGPLRISDAAGTAAIGADPPLPVVPTSPLTAEEAFSVYDHPPVWIFRKSARFDAASARALLSSVDLSDVVAQTPRQATSAPGMLMMPAARWARQVAGGTWSRMFHPDGLLNRSAPAAVAAWLLLFVGIGALALPLAFAVFPGLPDRGFFVSKILGLLVVAWGAWLLPALDLAPFGPTSILAGALLLTGLSGWALRTGRGGFASFARSEWRLLLLHEALFALLFAAGLAVRWMNPDLWQPWTGGEKPMALANLNAVLKSTSFPPHHPWFSGGVLNYYYFGYVATAVPIRLLGIVPTSAYNLALPTLFALAGCGVFGAAFALSGGRTSRERAGAGAAAVLLLLLVGNLGQLHVLGRAFQRAAGQTADRFDPSAAARGAFRVLTGETALPARASALYWDATRIVPATRGGEGNEITEFPFFTFLFGDLHPHVMALPWGLLSLAFSISLFRARGLLPPAAWAAGALALGAVRVTNPWDFPAQAALAAAAILAGGGWRRFAPRAAALVGLGFLLFRPLDAAYVAPYSSLVPGRGPFTPLAGTLYVHGLFLLAGAAFVLSRLAASPRDGAPGTAPRTWSWRERAAAAAFLIAFAASVLAGVSAAWVLGPLLGGSLLVALHPPAAGSPEERAVALLFAAGASLALAAEVVAAGGDRMNTLFKFSFQAWTFFATAAGAALAFLWRERERRRRAVRVAWTAAFALVLGAAGLYTVTALPARLKDRFPGVDGKVPPDPPTGLDGFAFARLGALRNPDSKAGEVVRLRDDAAAIEWMNRNVPGTPVLVEAQTVEYRWGSRYSVYTGLPAVIGWSWHVRQHRAGVPGEVVPRREKAVRAFYETADQDEAVRFLRRYGVRYVVVGPLETQAFPAEGLAKFEGMAARGLLSLAYRSGGVTLWEVRIPS